MSQPAPSFIEPGFVTAKEIVGGFWLVGLMFTDKKAGEGAMRAIIELYNSTGGFGPGLRDTHQQLEEQKS